MYVSKVLTMAAALAFVVVSAEVAAQGRANGRAQSPGAARGQGAKVTKPVQAQGAKANRPAQAQGPKTPRPGAGHDRSDRPTQSARGNQEERSVTENIARNPQQEARLKALLPEGMTLEQAAEGFRNQGQFIAALQTSKNQNIPFADLKAKMTGENPLSLGQAISELRPEPATTPTTTGTPAATTNQ